MLRVGRHNSCYRGRSTRRERSARAGVALPLVLAFIVVAMLLCAAMTRTVLLHHRQLRVAIEQEQTQWLVESGVQRALHQLQKSTDYRGERWHVPAASLKGTADASVLISVEPDGESHPGWKIVVESRFPDLPVTRVVCQRELSVRSSTIAATPRENMEPPELKLPSPTGD